MNWLTRLLGHHNYKRFIILGRSRTGSNLLGSYLNSHPHIYMRAEIFQRLNGREHQQILSNIFSRKHRKVRAVGFKIFYYHPIDDRSGVIWNHLINMPGLAVIHLKRRNILRTLISKRIALANKVWVKKQNSVEPEKTPVECTVRELAKGFEQTKQWEADFDNRFQHHDKLEVFYEDLSQNTQQELNRIVEFLGVPVHELRTPLIRQNPECTSALLKNYAELKHAFAGTRWQQFFES